MKGKKTGSSGRNTDLTMAERSEVEKIVENVVAQVLDTHVAQLRDELVRRVLEELPPSESAAPGVPGQNGAAGLVKAISAIQAGTTQKEILRALLDNMAPYSRRGALFVIKAGAASGWQGRGFNKGGEDAIKDFGLNVSAGVSEQALHSRVPFTGNARDIDPEFVSRFGAPSDDRVLILPLVLKEKVAALVYADAGLEAGGKLDGEALEVLVLATSAWLEVASLRKQAQKEEISEAVSEKIETTPTVHTSSAVSDPFAAHAPKHVAPIAAPVSLPQVVTEQPATAAHTDTVAASAAAAPAPAADAFANLTPEDADVHRKAQRFARLLVDEIKLYNQVKVTEGRRNKDLYDRLKDDIEKSRITYKKRYGSTVAGDADYFSQELIRSLAEDDLSIMGANFRRN